MEKIIFLFLRLGHGERTSEVCRPGLLQDPGRERVGTAKINLDDTAERELTRICIISSQSQYALKLPHTL